MSPIASLSDSSEWLETDELRGFASGTATGIRTRRYHALLLTATAPPAGRTVLVNGMDVWLDTRRSSFALSSQRYVPGVVHPEGVNRGQLYDVVDIDHRPGAVDQSIRPNQIFAVAGLPLVLLPEDRARRVVDAVETELYTPLGLRSLTPGEDGYVSHHEGNVWHGDIAYHQGTAWPWLIGPFVEAWVRVRGNTADAKKQARQQFLEPFVNHLGKAGLGHEIVDAEPPHTPRGCPFQPWSLGELLRLDRLVLGEV